MRRHHNAWSSRVAVITVVAAVAAYVMAFVTPAASRAQPLTDRIPAGTIVYIGWRGTDTLGQAYDNSHLAAVLNASNFRAVLEQTIPRALEKLPADQPEMAAAVQAAVPLLKHAWKRPTAFFVATGTDKSGHFEPKVGLICDAGDAAAADFHKALAGLIEQAKNPRLKTALVDRSIVIATIGYDDPAAALKQGAKLRESPEFAAAMKQLDADPVVTAMVNVEQFIKALDADAAHGAKSAGEDWAQIRDAMGLAGLKRIAFSGAFDGADWSSRTFVEAPSPRHGMLTLLGDQPVRPSLLKCIPQTTAYAMVHQFDLGRILATARAALVEAKQKDAVNALDRGLAAVTQKIGVDVRALLDPLGDQWAGYADAGVGGVATDGLVIVNELDDPAKAEAALKNAGDAIVRFGGPRIGVQAADVDLGGVTVHSFLLPQGQVQPGWTIKYGRLFVGMKPSATAAATLVGNPATGGKCFADNEKFNAIRQRLSAGNPDADAHMAGFEFADLPQTAPQKHAELAQLVMFGNMLMARWGVALPANLLPTLQVLQQHLAPAGSVSWVDDSGWHQRGTSPFPGSGLFSSQQTQLVAVGTGALTVSILLPSLNRARETANRVKCASNMRQIGQAMLLYSNDRKGKYPDDAGSLLKTEDITIEVFTCPSGDVEPPADVITGPVDLRVAWVNGSSPYTYVGKSLTSSSDGDLLVLYEREDDHGGDGMNMLFADGSVQWESLDAAKQIIAAKRRPKNPVR